MTKPLLKAIGLNREVNRLTPLVSILLNERLKHYPVCGVGYKRCNTCREADTIEEIAVAVAEKFLPKSAKYETAKQKIDAMNDLIRRRMDL